MSSEKKDGAVEKLMEEGTKQVESSGDKYDELKLDVSEHNIETAYAGMGKEELMKYANSPFWVRLRWLLFVIFWMSWFAMMFGALFIIFMTPKCTKQESNPKSPVYIISASSLLNNSSLNGIDEKIEYIQKLGVENVVLTSVLYTTEDGVTDFNKTNEFSLKVLKDLITKLKTNGLKVMLKLEPSHSSITNVFFLRSALSEPIYKDFYIWNPGFSDGVNKHPINNWLTVDGETAWTWDDNRKEYYFHQFSAGKPDFNFRNEVVVKYFEDIFKYWLKQGFDGLYLDQVQYLFKAKDFQNETEITPYTNKYNSLNHTSITSNLPETNILLSNWGKLMKSSSGLLIVSDLDSKDMISDVNMVHSSVSLNHDFTGTQLLNAILSKLNTSSWPSWEWVCSDPSKSWKNETIDAFNILGSLLRGTPFINADPKLFENNHIPNITLIENTLKELRSLPTSESGSFNPKLLNNDTVFAFDRIMSGTESLVFAWNLSKNVTLLNLNSFDGIPAEVNLSLCTQSACSILPLLKSKVKSDNISLAAESAVVLNF